MCTAFSCPIEMTQLLGLHSLKRLIPVLCCVDMERPKPQPGYGVVTEFRFAFLLVRLGFENVALSVLNHMLLLP